MSNVLTVASPPFLFHVAAERTRRAVQSAHPGANLGATASVSILFRRKARRKRAGRRRGWTVSNYPCLPFAVAAAFICGEPGAGSPFLAFPSPRSRFIICICPFALFQRSRVYVARDLARLPKQFRTLGKRKGGIRRGRDDEGEKKKRCRVGGHSFRTLDTLGAATQWSRRNGGQH